MTASGLFEVIQYIEARIDESPIAIESGNPALLDYFDRDDTEGDYVWWNFPRSLILVYTELTSRFPSGIQLTHPCLRGVGYWSFCCWVPSGGINFGKASIDMVIQDVLASRLPRGRRQPSADERP